MRTKTINLYKYDELSDEAKTQAREWWLNGGLDYDWHRPVYDDAEMIGFEIMGFDIDRGNYVQGGLMIGLMDTIDKILENHGETCATYQLALEYKKLALEIPDNESQASEESINELEDRLKEEYLKMLKSDYEYRQSEEYVAEVIRGNGYTFTINGVRMD